jgi:L-aspartate oxidase
VTIERTSVDGPLVVGSGVAGLSVALSLPRSTVLTAGHDGSTSLAQGGIAAAIGPGDGPAAHADDTVSVAGGIAVRRAVDVMTGGGPRAIERLLALGAPFDRDATGSLQLGREAGHRRRRIVHADGDATGAAVQATLTTAAVSRPSVTLLEGWQMIDLLRDERGVTGVLAADPAGSPFALSAPAVVLATGGIGRLYRYTTNPVGSTGAGLAAAARAGARLVDLEFVQFHPTALMVGRDQMPLLTEALRGDGATLVDRLGRRFLLDEHADGELAPRDVVARSIWRQLRRGGGAYLDVRSIADIAGRFPTAVRHAREAGLDPTDELLPVSPAAHFHMGGIDAGSNGRTSVPGLWALGEVASTGVHGANRLASNSLLEGLVFSALTARDIEAADLTVRPGSWTSGLHELPLDWVPEIDDVRQLMWDQVGVERSGPGLCDALATLDELRQPLCKSVPGRVAFEVATLVTVAALRRPESRGGHHRADHPLPDPLHAGRIVVEPVPAAVA